MKRGETGQSGSARQRQGRGQRATRDGQARLPNWRYVLQFRLNSLTLEQRLDPLVEFLKRGFAFDLLAVDEKGRRRIDFQNVGCVFLVGDDLVEQRLILQAGFDLALAQARL